jgi:hypothetical protein
MQKAPERVRGMPHFLAGRVCTNQAAAVLTFFCVISAAALISSPTDPRMPALNGTYMPWRYSSGIGARPVARITPSIMWPWRLPVIRERSQMYRMSQKK